MARINPNPTKTYAAHGRLVDAVEQAFGCGFTGPSGWAHEHRRLAPERVQRQEPAYWHAARQCQLDSCVRYTLSACGLATGRPFGASTSAD